MHALSARPLKVRELTDLRSKRGRRRRDRVSGRGSSAYADGIKRIFFVLLLVLLRFYLVGVGVAETGHRGSGFNHQYSHLDFLIPI